MIDLIWDNKKETLENMTIETNKILIEDKESSKNWDATENMYIEGDNLDALRILYKDYKSKIKMIYIDPPYNTEKKFMYNDTFRNKRKKECRHGGWLNMMYPRLSIARDLLTDDGVIFISIDDNEVHNLRKICDGIFGETNFIGLFTIQSNPRGSQASKFLANVHEYIYMYSKYSNLFELNGFEKSEENIKEYSQKNEDGKQYRLLGLRQRGGAWKREDRPKMYYPIYVNPLNGKVSLEKNNEFSIEVLPKRPSGEDSRWTWGKEKLESTKEVIVGKSINRTGEVEAWDIFRKDYLKGEDGVVKTTKPKTIWTEKEINYQNARNDIKNLFGNSELFDFPKPVYLVKQLIKIMSSEDSDIILDFFSGSATTAHAVMQLNAEDGGNRKYIMVQIPEKTDETSEAYKAGYQNICEIGKERIRRAGDKILQENNNLDVGFKVFKIN